ncbi:bacteriophage holin [Natronorarus salvus]|uniref:bacteriophage holin n=1 Tax=Natronorarus salvus TaxID=3117733 RepID=UPI002F26176B
MDSETHAVNARALGMTLGTVWAIVVAVLVPLLRIGWRGEWRELLANAYIGYDDTATGTLVGMVWPFVDGLVLGTALGRSYDRFDGRSVEGR